LFLAGLVTLSYLPLPIRLPIVVKPAESFTNAALAWRTLGISAVSLGLAFAVWFMWSAIAVKLNDAGFGLTKNQLFWLTATPVILGSLLRIPYGLIVSRFGSRLSYAAVTLLLLLPALGTGFAVQDPKTPYWVLLFWSAVTGIAGANFATSMAAVTLWFPKQLQGSALGINGLGNLGVTIAQFTIPLVIGFSLLGASEASPGAPVRSIHLGNAAFVWIPIILICSAAIWFGTKDYPAEPKTLASQLVAGKRLHTWVLSLLYFLTFGCFVAMGASLPLIIKEVFAAAPGGAPVPLLYAPWAAAIATVMRPVGGWLADKLGAGLITSISIATMAVGGFSLSAFLQPDALQDSLPRFLVASRGSGSATAAYSRSSRPCSQKRRARRSASPAAWERWEASVPPLLLGWMMGALAAPPGLTRAWLFRLLVPGCERYFYHRRNSITPPLRSKPGRNRPGDFALPDRILRRTRVAHPTLRRIIDG
jgi:NNP family nitrate/nitrite transporter-like MFS transporter